MDIKKTVIDLLESGLTQQQLAELVKCRQSTISSYVNGSRGARPTLRIGKRLEYLHKKLCKSNSEISSKPRVRN